MYVLIETCQLLVYNVIILLMMGGIIMSSSIKKLNAFISYSHKDTKYKDKLLVALGALSQSYNIEPWYDGKINAGNNIDEAIKKELKKSHIILLLITNNFINSSYCMDVELKAAKKRENVGKCIVIPVIFQESLLTDTLSFFENNRVPEDGKAITNFRPQDRGCTQAVKMIQRLIDDQFPNCKKPAYHKKHVNKNAEHNDSIGFKLYQNGNPKIVPVSQNVIDMIPKYHSDIYNFCNLMVQSLTNASQKYSELNKKMKKSGKSITDSERLKLFKIFLMDICAYTKIYITDNMGIKVHFRASKNNNYVGLVAATDEDITTNLSVDWTTNMTPIPMYRGLIYYSSLYHAPLIKSLNPKLNFKGKNDKIWKDYVTFTFPKLHNGQTPLLSYCISVHKDCYRVKGELLKVLAYLNIGEIVEDYIYRYCKNCKKIDKNYDINNIIQAI